MCVYTWVCVCVCECVCECMWVCACMQQCVSDSACTHEYGWDFSGWFQDSDFFQKPIKMALRCILSVSFLLSGSKIEPVPPMLCVCFGGMGGVGWGDGKGREVVVILHTVLTTLFCLQLLCPVVNAGFRLPPCTCCWGTSLLLSVISFYPPPPSLTVSNFFISDCGSEELCPFASFFQISV